MSPEPRNKDVLGRAEGEVIWVGAEALGEAGSLLSMPPESRKRQRGKYPGLSLLSSLQASASASHWPNFAGSQLAMGTKQM